MADQHLVFVSYARDDAEGMRDVMTALKPVISGLGLTIWQDGEIRTGDTWNRRISDAMARAKTFLPLVSQAFLASEYILTRELPAMLKAQVERDALVLPVILEDCFWEDQFGPIQAAPLNARGKLQPISSFSRRASGLHAVAMQVRRALAPPAVSAKPAAKPRRAATPRKPSLDLPVFARVPAGKVRIGATSREEAREHVPEGFTGRSQPLTTIEFDKDFLLGRYPVTVGQFKEFVKHGKHDASTSWQEPGFDQTNDHPVVSVSWDDAVAYTLWLSEVTGKRCRLPSEAEWEYAARAGTTTARYWGDAWDDYARYAHVLAHATAKVGTRRPNGFGLYDMLGNVWEWTADCWNPNFRRMPKNGRARLTGDCTLRVARGASWTNIPWAVRATTRFWDPKETRLYNLGFRVACDA